MSMSRNPPPSPPSASASDAVGAAEGRAPPDASAADAAAASAAAPPSVPMDVLLSPILPSADAGKLQERLSQLRGALEAGRQREAFLQAQLDGLQPQLASATAQSHQMHYQLVELQHANRLLGGHLQASSAISWPIPSLMMLAVLMCMLWHAGRYLMCSVIGERMARHSLLKSFRWQRGCCHCPRHGLPIALVVPFSQLQHGCCYCRARY